jgi:hypothetical protein
VRAALALGLLLAAAFIADGSLLMQQNVTTNPSAGVPVTLAAIGGVNTVLGTSLTNASVGPTTAVTLPLLAAPASVLTIQRGSANWTVQIKVTATSGLVGGVDSVTMSLVGATTQSVTVTSATALPATSSSVSLLGSSFGGTNITVKAASGVAVVGGCGGLSTCTLTMQIVITGGGGSPVATYAFSLRAT